MRGLRMLLYCHNALGLGHLVRTGAIAAAIRRQDPSVDVLVVTGAQITIPELFPDNVAYVKLPSARLCSTNGQVTAAAAHMSLPFHDLRTLRAAIIKTVVTDFRPDACLVDHNPAGFYNELDPAISAYRQLCPNGKLILGMRGIAYGGSDDEDYVKKYSSYLRTVYDKVLVYVDPSILDIRSIMSPEIAAKVEYTGYVTRVDAVARKPRSFESSVAKRTIVLAAGSGSVGYPMMQRVIEALGEGAEPTWQVLIVTGPYMDNRDVAALHHQISHLPSLQLARIVRVADDVRQLLSSADLFIGQAGYNTLVEVMATGCPAIVVPYETLHREQLAHALLLEQRGLVSVIRENELTASLLLSAIRRRLGSPPATALGRVDLDGADRAAKCVLDLARPTSLPPNEERGESTCGHST